MTFRAPQDMMEAVTASMQERTGRTLEEWVALVQDSGVDPLDQNAVRRWLKAEHGVKQNSQWAIADAAARAAGWVPPTLEEYIGSQYSGPKAHLRPIFERLREVIEALGTDVSVEGRSNYTPFVRRRQFAAVAAATKSRVDLGLRFKEAPASVILTPSKGPGQATHKVELTAVEGVTDEVQRLVAAAYEQN